MMSRKNYEAIASVFAAEVAMVGTLSNSDAKKSAEYSLRNVVLSLADKLAQDSPRFDRDRFYTACGLVYTPISGWWPKSV